MLHYAIFAFLFIALVAGILSFGGVAGAAVGTTRTLFVIFLILFATSFEIVRRNRI